MALFQGNVARLLHPRRLCDSGRIPDDRSVRKADCARLNLRAYDASKQTWNIKWLNALTGTWMNLAPSALGGVKFNGQSITYAFKELAPVDAAHAYTRATYPSISNTHFTWRGEKSDDGNAWSEFMVVDCQRSRQSEHYGPLAT